MKTKCLVKKDDLMKTVLKNRVTGKNYIMVIKDVENTLNNVCLKYFVFLLFINTIKLIFISDFWIFLIVF